MKIRRLKIVGRAVAECLYLAADLVKNETPDIAIKHLTEVAQELKKDLSK